MPRKQAFSGKQKKKQLKEKRERKKGDYDDDDDEESSSTAADDRVEILRVHHQPINSKDFDPNRYRLHFLKINADEMKKRRADATKPIVKVKERELEISMESVFLEDNSLDFPKRPPWDYTLTKEQLDKQEETYFRNYLHTLLTSHNPQQLSYFELNLETWRQLWRVTEISDVLLLISDIRYPVLHLPPNLYHYLRGELKREVVIVLNKVDLAPPSIVAAWHSYIKTVFPEAHIVCFSSFPKMPEEIGTGLHARQKRKYVKSLGPQELLNVCRDIVKTKVNLESWQQKLDLGDISTSAPARHDELGDSDAPDYHSQAATTDYAFGGVYQRFRDGILTIGCIGFPNVGKSSLLNGLVGKKVVSVSKTPGHTKHLQTIFLTPTVRLSDCPGLVFPSYVDKSLQILSGIFPIAQVREPYVAVGYLAQRIDIPHLLRLPHPEMPGKPHALLGKDTVWSAYDICEGWAIKSGYFTAKASRPDVYRAANQILRMAVEGRLRLCYVPPNYFEQEASWKTHPFATSLAQQLNKQACAGSPLTQLEENSSESDSETDDQAYSSDADSERDSGVDSKETKVKSCADSNPFALLSDD